MKGLASRFFRELSRTAFGQALIQKEIECAMQRQVRIEHKGVEMTFAVPNAVSRYRAESFSTKEPDTLEWIESIPEGGVLWDVGANVGLYSIYAALLRGCSVFAFEPSVFNLELLARNIALNRLQEQITIVPIALSNVLGVADFRMSNTSWGGALSTFGQRFDQTGADLAAVFAYRTLGLSMDQAATLLQIPVPQFVKMDVDGLEHFIVQGGANVLKQAHSVLVEINDSFADQATIAEHALSQAGLRLVRKCDLGAPPHFNQLWNRIPAS